MAAVPEETKNATGIKITVESPFSEAATILIRELSLDLGERYGDDGAGAFKPDDVACPGGAFVIAWAKDQPAGCGALKPVAAAVAEIKRMFVRAEFRQQGIARLILQKLESLAAAFGNRRIILETGILQPEAIALYEKAA